MSDLMGRYLDEENQKNSIEEDCMENCGLEK